MVHYEGDKFYDDSFKEYLSNSTSIPFMLVSYGGEFLQKIVDGKIFYKNNNESEWKEGDNKGALLFQLVHVDMPNPIPGPREYSSHDSPRSQPAPVRFSIPAEYDGHPANITGTLSYKLFEYDCRAGEKVTANDGHSQNNPSAEPAVPQKKSFWTVVLEFLASLKFW